MSRLRFCPACVLAVEVGLMRRDAGSVSRCSARPGCRVHVLLVLTFNIHRPKNSRWKASTVQATPGIKWVEGIYVPLVCRVELHAAGHPGARISLGPLGSYRTVARVQYSMTQ